jgi:predicted amidohydrolase
MTRRVFRVAAAQYDLTPLEDFAQYAAKIEQWVSRAVGGGASLLVFPEYAAMELASLADPHRGAALTGDVGAEYERLREQIAGMQRHLADFVALHGELAQRFGVYILAATFPVCCEAGDYRNRAHLFGPGGAFGTQDKLVMTRFERERWGIRAALGINVFATELGVMAVNICYDSEFPLIARRQAEQGAELLLVPSCTDGLAGYYRVRWACQTRALESQCYVVQAPTVGNAPWSLAVDENWGAAGIFAPPDLNFPCDGVVALGRLNEPSWLFADVDLGEVARVRAEGQVSNLAHWPDSTIPTSIVTRVRL